VESRRHPAQKYNFRFYTVRFETPAPSPTKSGLLSLPSLSRGGSRAPSAAPTPPATRPETWRRLTGAARSLASTAPNTPSVLAASVMGTPVVDDPTAVTNNDAMDLGIKVLQRFVKQSKSVPQKAGLRKSFAGWRNYTTRIKRNTLYAMKIASLMRRSIQRRYMYRMKKYALEQAYDGLVISQFVRTRRSRLTRLTFGYWIAEYHSLLGVRRAVARSAQRILRRHLAGAFYDWADFVARKMENIRTAVTAEEEREARKASLERMMNNKRKRLEFHWNERRTRLAWGAWGRWLEDEKRVARLLARAVGRLSARLAAAALERWASVANKRRRDRLVVTHVLAKLSREGPRRRVLRVAGRVERQEGLGAQGEVGGEVHQGDSPADSSRRLQPLEGQGEGVRRGGDQGAPRAAAVLPARGVQRVLPLGVAGVHSQGAGGKRGSRLEAVGE